MGDRYGPAASANSLPALRSEETEMNDAAIRERLKDAICDDTQWSRETPSKFIWDRVDAIFPLVKELLLEAYRQGYGQGETALRRP
jgi:hypothetical protein